MKHNPLTRHYPALTPEERFKLILAASDRDDDAECARLVASAARLTFRMPDYAPFIHAYHDVAFTTYPHLVDSAAEYVERFWMADCSIVDERDAAFDGDEAELDDSEGEPSADDGVEPAAAGDPGSDCDPFADERRKRPTWVRHLEMAYAAGFILNVRVAGWKLFSERLNIPPFTYFKVLPGFDRLKRALKMAEETAFRPEGMLNWLNSIRPTDAERVTFETIISPEVYARRCEAEFRGQVEFWGG
jgi:hypothetical protein